jgi:[acyl-carrier-protein] S-malonyltransferase
MKAILFPGQGSQIVGMGSDFFKNFEIVKKIFDEADNSLNFKISKIILEGPENELKLTANTQPAILTVSYAIFSVLKKEFNYDFSATKFFAGHSLGEYSALVCADSLVFKDAIFLLHERGKSMQEAVSVGKGGMLAVLGLDLISINNYINEMNKKGVCEVANDNAEGQIIVSGDIECIKLLQDILKKDKKKSILLM